MVTLVVYHGYLSSLAAVTVFSNDLFPRLLEHIIIYTWL